MKKVLNLRSLTLAVLSFILGLCALGLFLAPSTTTFADESASASSAQENVFTATELGIQDETPVSVSSFFSDESIEFYMEAGATLRDNVATPGITYKAYISKAIDTQKPASAEDTYYVMFTAQGKSLFVEATPVLGENDMYEITASVTYDGVSEANFNAYKALEISAQAVLHRVDGADQVVILADENDNTLTMESVVNAVKLAEAYDDTNSELVALLDEYVPEHSTNYNLTEKQYLTADNNLLETASYVYVNGIKKEATTIVNGDNGILTIVDNDGKFSNMPFFKADKVIKTTADLTQLGAGTASAPVSGYFVLANDIEYVAGETASVPAANEYTFGATGSMFTGTLDGQGYTINFGVTKGGLFGQLKGTVKNVSLIVKAVGAKDYGSNVILAGYSYPQTKVENVYAKYDIENFSPDLGWVTSGIWRSAGLGFVEASNSDTAIVGNTYENVILDLSNVTLVGDHGSDTLKNYGLFFCPSNSAWFYGATKNTYVIWGEEILHFYNGSKIAYAESDSGFTTTLTGALKVLPGISRYDTLAEMAAAVQKVGNFAVTETGITWSPIA